jgi:hypothetical protein
MIRSPDNLSGHFVLQHTSLKKYHRGYHGIEKEKSHV